MPRLYSQLKKIGENKMTDQMNTNNVSDIDIDIRLLDEMIDRANLDMFGDYVLSLTTYENILYSFDNCESIFAGMFPDDDGYMDMLNDMLDLYGCLCRKGKKSGTMYLYMYR